MARIVSFLILVAIAIILGVLLFEVLSSFLLPMFIALLLAIMFRPVNERMLKVFKGHNHIAAAATTMCAIVVVLLPMLWVVILATNEMRSVVGPIDRQGFVQKFVDLRRKLDLEMPPSVVRSVDLVKGTLKHLQDIKPTDRVELAQSSQELKLYASELRTGVFQLLEPDADGVAISAERRDEILPALDALSKQIDAVEVEVEAVVRKLEQVPTTDKTPVIENTYRGAVAHAKESLDHFQEVLIGGPVMAMIKENVNISEEELQNEISRYTSLIMGSFGETAGVVSGFLFDLIVGLGITIISLHYFLADGPAMIKSITQLSPLDERYKLQLLDEFGTVSRAVILAMLVAAFMQGLLAGIGYYFVGFSNLFLLTLVTMLFAMVPVVGATVIWGGACLWLFLIDGEMGKAIGLAIYCTCVVSMADNVIKPYVLHGKTNLHPLLGLLSVLGGAKALGPIGLVVGPMVVVFLQTLLLMLRDELTNWDQKKNLPITT